jgi:hypothetical protein
MLDTGYHGRLLLIISPKQVPSTNRVAMVFLFLPMHVSTLSFRWYTRLNISYLNRHDLHSNTTWVPCS